MACVAMARTLTAPLSIMKSAALVKCSCGINHIINKDHISSFNISDQLHGVNNIGFFTLLVANHNFAFQVFGIGISSF